MVDSVLGLSPAARSFVDKFRGETKIAELRDMCLNGTAASAISKAHHNAYHDNPQDFTRDVGQVCGKTLDDIANAYFNNVSPTSPIHPLTPYKVEVDALNVERSDANAKLLMDIYYKQATGDAKVKVIPLQKTGSPDRVAFQLDCPKAYYATALKQLVAFKEGRIGDLKLSGLALTSATEQEYAGRCFLGAETPNFGRQFGVLHSMNYLAKSGRVK